MTVSSVIPNIVLTIYPATSDLKSKLAGIVGRGAAFVSVRDLRQSGNIGMLKALRGLRGGKVFLPVEDEEGSHLLPALQILASFIPSRGIISLDAKGDARPVSRGDVVKSAAALVTAEFKGDLFQRKAAREIAALMATERFEPEKPAQNRVLYLNSNLWFGVKAGGSVGHISGVVNGMHELGIPVEFVAVGGRLLIREAVPYFPLTPPAQFAATWEKNCYAFHFSAVEQVGRIAAQRDFGWIYQRLSVCNYSGVVLSRKLGKPLVLEYNGSEAWIAKNWGRPLRRQDLAERIEEANLKHAHLIVTISDVLKDELLARGIPRERIVVYPNCFDPEAFDPQRFSREDVAALRQRYGIADDAMVVTFLGTFGQWHGAAVLAAAARQILDANADWVRERKLHFMFVGDGVKMPDVRAALGPHASGGNVTLTGLVAQAQAPMYLAASDVLASPHVANADGSRFFGSPTKLFEYMAMEKAILASDLDQIGEVLTPGLAVGALPPDDTAPDEDKVALLTVPGSAEEIAAGIAFLARRPDWRRSLAAAARRRALAKYTWRHHVTAIVDQAKDLGLVERLASSDQGGGSAG